MRSRFIKVIMFVILLFSCSGMIALAEEEEQQVDERFFINKQMDHLQLDEIERFWDDIATEYGGFLPETQKMSLLEWIRSGKKPSLSEWGKGLIQFFFHELIANGKLMGSLILLTVFCVILQSLQNAFEQHTISKVAYAITYMVLVIIALNSFHVAIDFATATISTMNHFMIALLPLLLVLMASTGGLASVALFHPLIIFLVYTSGSLVHYIVLPLLFFSALLSIVSSLSTEYKVTKLATFLRTAAVGILGAFLTVFLGVISVQGAATAVSDGITIRTAKFLASNLVPVVGMMFTDAADTVLGASLLLKNTVGIVGLVILVLICAFPALKVLALALTFNFSAALLQPLGGGPIADCLSIIGKSVIYVFAAMSIVCFMFFLAITIMIISGNVALMMR